jgi:hypothetical protein
LISLYTPLLYKIKELRFPFKAIDNGPRLTNADRILAIFDCTLTKPLAAAYLG